MQSAVLSPRPESQADVQALAPDPPGWQRRSPRGKSSVYYPPTRTGMRGSHPGPYEVAHALAWSGQKPARHRKLGEHYDLVIVGAGLSGLAAGG